MAQQSMKKRQPVKMGCPMGGGMGAGEKAKDFKGTVKKLAKYLTEFRWHMLMVAIFAIGSTTFAIVSPKILGGATNQIVEDYVSMKAYETMFVLVPELEKEAIDAEIARVKAIIEKAGEVENVDEWGSRKLAYTIDNKYTDGYYVVIDFKAENSVLDDLNHLYLINDSYIRDIIIAKEK